MRGISIIYEMHEKFGHIWLLPDGNDCLDFGSSEIGEVFDALMRLNIKYFRNNERYPDVKEEICDVIMMLVKYYMNIWSEEELIRLYFTRQQHWIVPCKTTRDVLYACMAIISTYVLNLGIATSPYKASYENQTIMYLQPFDAIELLLYEVGYDAFELYMIKKMEKYERKIAALSQETT